MDGSDLGKDPLMVSAMFNLPIWEKKNRAAVAQAQAQEAAARHALDEESNQLHAARSEAHFALSDALRREALHEDTLRPLAESALQVAEQAYRTGQSTFQEWIDALQLLLDLELSLLRAQTDQALAHATLEQLLGTPESKPAPINPHQTH
jgi:outer membrane protein TolC